MESLIPVLNAIDTFMWGPPLITLLVGTGIFLTVISCRCSACRSRSS